MFLLLFRYVFGGAISTPGIPYVEFLIPGIIVQNIAFGGFVTAIGLNEDLHKGLIDRFRSLPMARPAVLAGRTLVGRRHELAVGGDPRSSRALIIGFSFNADVFHVIAGILLLLLFGYAFSWVFAFVGLIASTPESANSVGVHRDLPADVHLVGVRPGRVDARTPAGLRPKSTRSRSSSTRCARCGSGAARRQLRLGGVRVGDRRSSVVFAPLAVSRYRKHAGT